MRKSLGPEVKSVIVFSLFLYWIGLEREIFVSQTRYSLSPLKNSLFYMIGIFGAGTLVYLILNIGLRFNEYGHLNLLLKVLFYMFLFTMIYEWAVALPSGAKWKPAMVFILFSMIAFPIPLALVVMVPGVLFASLKNKVRIWDFFTTVGHLSLGITLGGLFFHTVWKATTLNSSYALASIGIALVIHFLVNRIVAVIIITYRKQNAFIKNFHAVIRDINWTYLCIYSLGMVMVLIDRVYSYLGGLAALVVIFSLFKSVSYYQKYKMIAKTVFIDSLTHAENRAAWELFKDEVRETSVLGSLIMADLDEFKEVNDTYGHMAGDAVLIEFVQNIQSRLKRPYRLFRFGGDEFVLYIPHKKDEEEQVYAVVENIISKQNHEWQDRGLPVTVSFGITAVTDSHRISDSLEQADSLMYSEKQAKKAL